MNFVEASNLLTLGQALQGEQAVLLEEALKGNQSSLDVRLKLLGYYRNRGNKNKADYVRHLIWIIDNLPTEDVAYFAVNLTLKFNSVELYEQVKKHWFKHLQSNQHSTRAVLSAADFCFGNLDYPGVIDCLEALQTTEPQESDFLPISGLCERILERLNDDELGMFKRENIMSMAIHWARLAARLERAENTEFMALIRLVSLVFAAGLPEAEELAVQLLEKAKDNPKARGYSTHVANTVLGKIALNQGNARAAAEHLYEAARVPNSEILYLKGPDMSLAQALLEAGDIEAVSNYLDQFDGYELSDSSKNMLNSWHETVHNLRS